MKLQDLQRQFTGRLFVVGNGPSLLQLKPRQIKALNKEFMFMGSRYCDWDGATLAPSFYIMTERRQAVHWIETGKYRQASASIAKFWVAWQPTPSDDWVTIPQPPSNAHDILNYGLRGGLEGTCSNGIDPGHPHMHHAKDSGLAAVEVGAFLGFSEIYLLGCETTTEGDVWNVNRQRDMHAPGVMRAYYEKAGSEINLVDCSFGGTLAETRGGPLPYRELDEVLGIHAAR